MLRRKTVKIAISLVKTILIFGEENDIQQQLLCEVGSGVQKAT
jgi:hypothetical protein